MPADPRFFIRELKQSLKRNIFLNISSITTVMVLIFQLGFFILIISNINNFTSLMMNRLQVTVIIASDLPEDKVGQLKGRIMKNPQVSEVKYVSKEEALKRLKGRFKGKMDLNDVTRNPLPDTFEVSLKNPDFIKEVAGEVEKYPGVDGIRYGDKQIVDRLLRLSYRLYMIGIFIITMLGISAVFLISNTIRLTVFSRRREIAIMELVGATRWFIRGPFVIEGLLHGVVGSGIAVVVLSVVYYGIAEWISKDMPFLFILSPGALLPKLGLFLMFTGTMIGVVSAFVSVSRYLKVSSEFFKLQK